MASHGGLKGTVPRNQLINSGNSRTSNCGSSASPAPPAANPDTNAQRIVSEAGVPWSFGTNIPPQVVNLKNDGKYTRIESPCTHWARVSAGGRLCPPAPLILNQPSTCAAKKDRVFLKSDGTGVT